MNSINSFSLSLQKQIKDQSVSIDTELSRAFAELKFRSLLKRSGITKNTRVLERVTLFYWHRPSWTARFSSGITQIRIPLEPSVLI
jgi:hypothetical protein